MRFQSRYFRLFPVKCNGMSAFSMNFKALLSKFSIVSKTAVFLDCVTWNAQINLQGMSNILSNVNLTFIIQAEKSAINGKT